MNDSSYFKVQEVADIYNVTTETIRRWARGGKLHGKRIGKDWFFHKGLILSEKTESTAQKILGKEAKRMSLHAPYDILYNGKKIDVKSTKLRMNNNKTGPKFYWAFKCYKWNLPKRSKGKDYCDYFMFFCFGNTYDLLLRIYLIPNEIVKKTLIDSFTINVANEEYEKYRMFDLSKKEEV